MFLDRFLKIGKELEEDWPDELKSNGPCRAGEGFPYKQIASKFLLTAAPVALAVLYVILLIVSLI